MRDITNWKTSLHSAGDGNCVEVGGAPNVVGVRDTKDREGGLLCLGRPQWHAFITGIKTGCFDR